MCGTLGACGWKVISFKKKDFLDSDNSQSSPEIKKSKFKFLKRKSCDTNEEIDLDNVFLPESKLQKMEESDSSKEQFEDEILGNDCKGDDNNNDGGDNTKKIKRAGSHYNPLYSFSDEERATMDKELEELMDEDDSSDSDEKEAEAHFVSKSFVNASVTHRQRTVCLVSSLMVGRAKNGQSAARVRKLCQ